MKPSRPYLVAGLYDWILDNDCTPYIVVDAEVKGVMVPEQFVQDGQIVLNITPGAVRDLSLQGDAISFNARFGGVPMNVYVPYVALLAIYAKENGMGMGFGMEPGAELYLEVDEVEEPEVAEVEDTSEIPEPDRPKKGRPSLKVIK